MTVSDEFEKQIRVRHDAPGATIDSIDTLESLAGKLEAIRASAPRETDGPTPTGANTPEMAPALDWNTSEMDAAPISMVISGPAYEDNPIWYANHAFERLTGYAEREVLGTNLRVLQGPETATEPVETLRNAVDIWEPTVVELHNYRRDGTRFRNRVATAPIADETGTISNWVGFQEAIDTAESRTN